MLITAESIEGDSILNDDIVIIRISFRVRTKGDNYTVKFELSSKNDRFKFYTDKQSDFQKKSMFNGIGFGMSDSRMKQNEMLRKEIESLREGMIGVELDFKACFLKIQLLKSNDILIYEKKESDDLNFLKELKTLKFKFTIEEGKEVLKIDFDKDALEKRLNEKSIDEVKKETKQKDFFHF